MRVFTGQKTVGGSDQDAELSEIQPDEKARQRSTQMVVLFV
jgi:hypothetical protein